MRDFFFRLTITSLIYLSSCTGTGRRTPEEQLVERPIPQEQIISTPSAIDLIIIESDIPKPNKPNLEPDAPSSSPATSNLSPKGPWLVYQGSRGLHGINLDGGGKTTLYSEHDYLEISHLSGSPTTNQLIVNLFVTHKNNMLVDVDMLLMDLPTGELEEVSRLLHEELSHDIVNWVTDELAAVGVSDPAWSPTGKHIAFVAVMDGPSSDLYVFDLEHSRTTRLTSSPYQELHPYWTTDGTTIIYFEEENIISLSEDSPGRVIALWSVEIDGTGFTKLIDFRQTPGESLTVDSEVLGWSKEDELLVYQKTFDFKADYVQEKYLSLDLGGGSPSEIDLDTIPKVTDIDPMRELIFRPGEEMEIVSPDQLWAGVITEGLISLINNISDESIEISAGPIDVFIWKPDSSGFFISTENTLYMVDISDGRLINVDTSVGFLEDDFTWVLYRSE